MWSNTPRVIIRKPPSKELRLLVAKLSPFVKFINIYVKMYTLIVQALLSLESYAQEGTWGGNKLIKIPQVRMKMASF